MARRTGRFGRARDAMGADALGHTAPGSGAAPSMGAAVAEALLGAARRRLRRWADPTLGLPPRTPERVLVAPPDILSGSAAQAEALYGGRFELAGHSVETHGASPFAVPDAPPEWRRALHGFGWLRHAAARDDALARLNARALASDWFREFGHPTPGLPWEPAVTAARLRHWLGYAPLLLAPAGGEANGGDAGFEDRFLRQLGLHRRALRRMALDAGSPLGRLHALAGATLASLALPTRRDEQRRLAGALDAELGAQILPDGGHVSRRADAALDLLAALLPLRACFVARGQVAPPGLLPAIDRMVPALAHHRLGDGSLARHNGTHAARLDRLAAVMALEGSDGRGGNGSGGDGSGGEDGAERALRVPAELPDSGYQRLGMGGTVVVVDAGAVPPPAHAAAAHAGALSFEMSANGAPLVVNLGASDAGDDWALALRSTPAHSTLALDAASSARVVPPGLARRLFGAAMVDGPTAVDVRRADATDGSFRGLGATHDGFRAHGVRHERVLSLREGGAVLAGEDRMRPLDGNANWTPPPATLRFHLHPAVGVEGPGAGNDPADGDAGAPPDGRVRLRVGDAVWWFAASRPVAVEATRFHDGRPQVSLQLTVRLDGGATGAAWSFEREARTGEGAASAGESGEREA